MEKYGRRNIVKKMVLKDFEVDNFVEAINLYFPIKLKDCDYKTCKWFVNKFCEDKGLVISFISVDKIVKKIRGDKE